MLNHACRRLSEANTLEEIKDIRDKAEAVRRYAKNVQLGLELQNRAAELKLRAERRAGELLSSLKLRGGDRKSNGHRDRLKLADLGITHNQSKRWQLEAAVPEEQFDRYLEHAHHSGDEISAAALLRLARQERRNGNSASANGARPRVEEDEASGRLSPLDCDCLGGAKETINELKGHCSAMANVLEQLCPTISNSAPQPNGPRLLARYIAEITQLINHLEQQLR